MNQLNPTGCMLDDAGTSRGFAVAKDGYISGFGIGSVISATATPAQTILPMIEQRIREQVEAQVEQARRDLEAAITVEVERLGLSPNLTNTFQFARAIAGKYRERLVADRIAALVDSLLPPAHDAAA